MHKTAPYGTWRSCISPQQVAKGAIRYGALKSAGRDIYWTEGRPEEGGRQVIVRSGDSGKPRDILPAPFSARSKVHEYGGGEFFLSQTGLFFTNAADQDLYYLEHFLKSGNRFSDKKCGKNKRIELGFDSIKTGIALGPDENIKRITNAPQWRFADGVYDAARNRLICVAEKRCKHKLKNLIVCVPLSGINAGKPQSLLKGRDFYAYPRLSPNGENLAWIEWDLPSMPWESSELWLGDIGKQGKITQKKRIAGGRTHAASEPQWDNQGNLYFISDQSGWGTIYRQVNSAHTPLPWKNHEFGRPLWGLGASSYVIRDDGGIVALSTKNGELQPGLYEGKWTRIKTPARQIDAINANKNLIAIVAATDTAPQAICVLDKSLSPISKKSLQIKPSNISIGETLQFATGNEQTAHGIYYPPCNAGFDAPASEAPPAIISAHGGPTGMADRGLKLKIQYWTSRGFAFFDIDYRGSTGYGRKWRNSLNGHWGIYDAQDMENGAKYLVSRGLADPDRLLISGSSAGGFTVLAALCSSSSFAAGASYYGIGDLEKLQACTHKFESGYLGTLLGTQKEIFKRRSPLFNADKMQSPVIFFQGSEDPVVPPSQSRDMHNSLRERGIATSYIEFEGESHGFRRADTIIRALTSEYSFYAQILGLEPADDLPDIKIDNFNKTPRQ